MAAQSKLNFEPTLASGRAPRKRTLTEKMKVNEDNAGKEDEPALKKQKTSSTSAVKQSQSKKTVVEDVEDDDVNPHTSLRPKNPNAILEASDGSDDEIEILDDRSSGQPTPAADSDNEDTNTNNKPKKTDKEELEEMQKKWRSPIYAFFRPEVRIVEIDGRKAHEFSCSAKPCRHSSGRTVRRYLDKTDRMSTSNLRRHAEHCWGKETVKAADECGDVQAARDGLSKAELKDGSITAVFKRTGKGKISYSHRQHNRQETRAEIVKWVTQSMRPYSIVEDEGFKVLMKTGRPEYYLPSRMTVARDVKQIFGRDYDGTLSFGTDAWTSPNHKAYVAVTVHFEQDGEPFSLLLDIVEVPRSHSGFNLAKAFAEILEDFGVSDKILSVTCDNASCNDTMIDELALLVEEFPGSANRTRCFTHILNLVAKCILKQFDLPKGRSPESLDEATKALLDLASDLEDEEEAMKEDGGMDVGEDDNDDGLVDVRRTMTAEEIKELEKSVQPVRTVLVKLRKLAFAIKNSSTIILPEWTSTLEDLAKAAKENGLEPLSVRMVPRDVATRWNSTYDMLEFAYDYRKAITTITANADMDLRKYELRKDEWKIVKDLRDVLKIFKDATLFFSRATPNLAKVIPAMDRIDSTLATAALNSQYSPAVQAAVTMGKNLLNKYYNLTDTSELYRIAMILHPSHKTTYFATAGWEADWITTATDIVKAEFKRGYASFKAVNMDQERPAASKATKSASNMFDDLPTISTLQQRDELVDELDRYLSLPTELTPRGPHVWWIQHKAVYPRLSRMALNYLNIPATSVDVERVFSKGRLILSHVRNRLSVDSTRASLCLGAWGRLGLIKSEDVRAVAKLPDVVDSKEVDESWDYTL